jgi:hypothetical protein
MLSRAITKGIEMTYFANSGVLLAEIDPDVAAIIVAALLVVFLVSVMLAAIRKCGSADDVVKVIGAMGTIIGLLVGSVPAYFFSRQANNLGKQLTVSDQGKRIAELQLDVSDRDRQLSAKDSSLKIATTVKDDAIRKLASAQDAAKKASTSITALVSDPKESKRIIEVMGEFPKLSDPSLRTKAWNALIEAGTTSNPSTRKEKVENIQKEILGSKDELHFDTLPQQDNK